MKRMLRSLKSFWFISIALWVVAALVGVYAVQRLQPEAEQEARWIVVALVSAVWLLAVVLRQYQRVRAERNIESLVEREVDRSVMQGQHDETEYDALSRRLKQVIERLRANRTAGGRGHAALSELPWYLVIGLPSSGKTSLLANSGLNASVVGGGAMASQSGTQTCDWYFSPESVMVDTSGRYITDDQAAEAFSEFLKLLRRQRRQAINGLIMVVSLPELLGMSPDARGALARQLLERAVRYRKSFKSLPPVYLFFSKADLMPGFEETFASLDNEARQQPWGMTFSVDEIRQQGLSRAFPEKFSQLVDALKSHVQRRTEDAGQHAENAMLRFPDYMSELHGVLSDFLAPFDVTKAEHDELPFVRGLYFTSALQTENRLPSILDEHLRSTFGLAAPHEHDWFDSDPGERIGDRRYFITNVFRSVVFQDRYLGRYIAKGGVLQALSPWVLGAGALAGTAAIAASITSYVHHHGELTRLEGELTQQTLSPEGRLDVLAHQLRQLHAGHHAPLPFDREIGLDPVHTLRPKLEAAYFDGLKQQMLMPVAEYLQARLQTLDTLVETTQKATPARPSAAGKLRRMAGTSHAAAAEHVEHARNNARERLTQDAHVSSVRSLSDAGHQLREQTVGRVRDAASSLSGDLRQNVREERDRLGQSGINALRNAAHARADTAENEPVNPALSRALIDNRLTPEQIGQLDESYSALKLYLILAEPHAHHDESDVQFARDLLPHIWKVVNEQRGISFSDASLEENVDLYAEYLKQGYAPALGRDEAVVERARNSLKAFLNNQSLVDRKYLQFQEAARQRYPSETLATLVTGNGRQLMYSADSIPAIYTRKVWDEFLRREILEAAAADLRVETDWVLDDSGSAEQMESKTSFVRQLMARYKHDYIEAWERFLAATGVRRFDSMDTANLRLSLLSDAQQSPLRQIMQAARDNTRWDAPSSSAGSEHGTEDTRGFWGKAMDVFSGGDNADVQQRIRQVNDLPGFHDGVLANHFAQIDALLAANDDTGNKDTIMDRYLRELRQLKVRFDNMRRAQDVGKNSKQLISETLSGGNTEVSTLRNDIAANIDVSDAPLSRSLERLFSAPVEYAWGTLYAPAGQQLARAWGARIDTPWRQKIVDRYPLSNAGNESSVADMRDFVDPNSGRLVMFKREEIGTLEEGDFDNALVDARMQATIRDGIALGTVIDTLANPQNGFEVMIEPSPYMTQIMLTLDGQSQDYRNGPQPWQRMTWPGDPKQPGARLEVTTLDNQRYIIANFPTRWGLLRLIDTAEVTNVDAVRQRFTWQTPAGPVSFLVRNFGGVRLTDLKKVHALVMPKIASGAPADKAEKADKQNGLLDEVTRQASEHAAPLVQEASTSASDAAAGAAQNTLKGVMGGQP